MSDIELKIVETMQKANKPLILYHISKRSKIPHQLVDYHLEKMIEKGLVISDEVESKTYYMLQPIFYDKMWLTALYKQLTPFVEDINSEENIVTIFTKIPREKIIVNVLLAFLRRFEKEIEKTSKIV